MEAGFYKILIVDDDEDVLEILQYNLRKEGFQVFVARNGEEAITLAGKLLPHLILLDVMMPEMDGIMTCEKIREMPATQNILVAFLTARGEDYSQIAGFEAGGDDYITKPIKPKVLVSRIKALLKRVDATIGENIEDSGNRIIIDNLVINAEEFSVKKDDITISLPKKEFQLIALLASKPSKVFTREDIFSKVWGDDVVVGDRTIDVHIRKLREKLGANYIKTVKGVGYKYEND